jgi:hypothetical protein
MAGVLLDARSSLSATKIGVAGWPSSFLGDASDKKPVRMARMETKDRLRRELKEGADRGAGLVELLDYLETSGSRLGRWDRLSNDERDELSLYCWSLKTSNKRSLIWDRASAMWGSFKNTSASGRRRPDRRSKV